MRKKIYLIPLTSLGLAAYCHGIVNIQTVEVGDVGNAADFTGYGAVNYEYRISTYEVTNSQYAAFLNSVASISDTHQLWNSNMADRFGGITRSGSSGNYSYSATKPDNPVNFVSFFDAARFSNWLTNGQPQGQQDNSTTETGMYFLNGVTNPENTSVNRDSTAWLNGGVAIASEDEWYKAAYHQPFVEGGDTDNYWLYPTGSNTAPSPAEANSSNGPPNGLTIVGYSVEGHYGTYDMAGNAEEWTEGYNGTGSRVIRGGSAGSPTTVMQSTVQHSNAPYSRSEHLGFRVTSLEPIPEPATFAAIIGLLGLGLAATRRSYSQ